MLCSARQVAESIWRGFLAGGASLLPGHLGLLTSGARGFTTAIDDARFCLGRARGAVLPEFGAIGSLPSSKAWSARPRVFFLICSVKPSGTPHGRHFFSFQVFCLRLSAHGGKVFALSV